MRADTLLAQVLKQFQVVYLDEPTKAAILAQALRVCQIKIGPYTDISFNGTVETPADFLSVAVAMDANGRWQEVQRVKAGGTDTLQIVGIAPVPLQAMQPSILPEIELSIGYPNGFFGAGRVASPNPAAPYRLYYFIDLAKAAEIPPLVESYLYDYLSVLIEIPNTRRYREVVSTTGMQIELPSEEELKQRKDLIENNMEEAAAIIPTAAIF